MNMVQQSPTTRWKNRAVQGCRRGTIYLCVPGVTRTAMSCVIVLCTMVQLVAAEDDLLRAHGQSFQMPYYSLLWDPLDRDRLLGLAVEGRELRASNVVHLEPFINATSLTWFEQSPIRITDTENQLANRYNAAGSAKVTGPGRRQNGSGPQHSIAPLNSGVNYFRTIPGGDFRVPQFWAPFSPVPPFFLGPGGANDSANFNLGFTAASRYTVTNVYGTNAQLLIHNDAVRLELSDDYTLGQGNNALGLRVGTVPGGTGDLVIAGSGIFRPGSTFIGMEPGATGHVTLDGVEWDGSGSTANIIGYFGPGSLTIRNGGVKTTPGLTSIGLNPSANGSMTVTDPGSSWSLNALLVGGSGTGSLDISEGGSVSTQGIRIAEGSNSSGTVTVHGPSSTLTTDLQFFVGQGGNATLIISNGGSVVNHMHPALTITSIVAGIFQNSVGTVTVTGDGSTWLNHGGLSVGGVGTGTLTISDGGQVLSKAVAPPWNGGFDIYAGVIGSSSSGTGSVYVTGEGSNWTADGQLDVGRSGTGWLEIDSGGSVDSFRGKVGVNAGSFGSVVVAGEGSSWNNSSWVLIGESGSGTMAISDGASVTSSIGEIAVEPGSSGHVFVTGSDSSWFNTSALRVGIEGNATLTIEEGGSVRGSFIPIATEANSSGTVIVSGAGSVLTLGDLGLDGLNVGFRGEGMLAVFDGGQVTGGGFATIGFEGNGVVNVMGPGAKFALLGLTSIGGLGGGNGVLNVSAGGAVNTGNGIIAEGVGSTGAVTIMGSGSSWTGTGNFSVGHQGAGTLLVENGALLLNTSGHIGWFSGSTGTATVRGAGSTWNNNGSLIVGQSGTGTLIVEEGGRVFSAVARIGELAGSEGLVSVTGDGSNWNISELLEIGRQGTGTLLVGRGSMINVGTDFYIGANLDNTLGFIVTGAEPSQYGRMEVMNDMTLVGGTFQVLLDGYAPVFGDMFDLFDFGGTLSGTFAAIDLPALSPGLLWDTSTLYTQGIVSVIPEPSSLGLILPPLLALMLRRHRCK